MRDFLAGLSLASSFLGKSSSSLGLGHKTVSHLPLTLYGLGSTFIMVQ